MRRIVNRRYGRSGEDVKSSGASHKISIGRKTTSRGGAEIPDKLSGFVILRDTIDSDNKPVIDFDAMRTLGYDEKATLAGIAAGFKADGVLPTLLRFVLISDAVRDGDGWSFPGIHAEAYECYQKAGRICHGDGTTAHRKQGDGSVRDIPCVPVGSADADPATYCEYSKKKECKSHSRLTLLLYVPGPSGPKPLCPQLGMSARYRFDTTSEYHSMEVLDELDRVADRLDGHLNGLTGTLTFSKRARRTGTDKTVVGHVYFQIDPEAVIKREQELRASETLHWNRQIELARANNLMLAAPAAPKAVAPVAEPEGDTETIKDAIPEEPVVVLDPEPAPEMDLEQDDNELELLVACVEKAVEVAMNDFGESYADTLNLILHGSKQGFKNRKGEWKQTQALAELTDGVDREKAIKFFTGVVDRLQTNMAVDAEFTEKEVGK